MGRLRQSEGRCVGPPFEAIELDPNEKSYYTRRGQAYWRLQKNDLALKDFNRAIELDPKDALGYGTRGAFLMFDKPESAIGERGLSYFALGKDDLAIRDYNAAIALHHKWPAGAYYKRALAYARKKDRKNTLQDLTKAVESDPYYKTKAQEEPQFHFVRSRPDFIRLFGRQ